MISSPSQALAGSSSSQANTPLIIGVSDWAPYSGYDLPGHGFLTEVIQVAMKRVGYKTIAQKTPWSRVIKGTSRGDIDIIPGIWYSDERAKTILYGTVLATARLVLISRVDHPAKIENIEDLDDLTVGIIQDYAYPSFFLEATNFTKDYSRNLVFNLKKLAKGRIDAALGDELVARYTTDKLFSGKVKFRYSESSLDSKSVFLGISLKNPNHDRILGDFENALAEMKADGTYQKLLEKHGIVETRKSS
ncbi:substrate-binding periplasmic protein [Kiloniella sp.]|uniref:substrate-binding periplasmic protein n=1 Tax=Kiloniella sp. TaxID=1938587 RepID=UPI003B01D058